MFLLEQTKNTNHKSYLHISHLHKFVHVSNSTNQKHISQITFTQIRISLSCHVTNFSIFLFLSWCPPTNISGCAMYISSITLPLQDDAIHHFGFKMVRFTTERHPPRWHRKWKIRSFSLPKEILPTGAQTSWKIKSGDGEWHRSNKKCANVIYDLCKLVKLVDKVLSLTRKMVKLE